MGKAYHNSELKTQLLRHTERGNVKFDQWTDYFELDQDIRDRFTAERRPWKHVDDDELTSTEDCDLGHTYLKNLCE